MYISSSWNFLFYSVLMFHLYYCCYALEYAIMNTVYKGLWDAVKALLRGKFIAANAYSIRKNSTQ
jgi:hypothetical protein